MITCQHTTPCLHAYTQLSLIFCISHLLSMEEIEASLRSFVLAVLDYCHSLVCESTRSMVDTRQDGRHGLCPVRWSKLGEKIIQPNVRQLYQSLFFRLRMSGSFRAILHHVWRFSTASSCRVFPRTKLIESWWGPRARTITIRWGLVFFLLL